MSKKEQKDPKQSEKKETEEPAGTGKERDVAPETSQTDDTEAKLQLEVAQLNDKYLRLYSEFDNYRKRTLKERIELSKTASADLIISLLPVLDDFERALRAMENNVEKSDPVKEGVSLIFNKMLNILTQQGLEQMNTTGKEFDTDFHEAITNIPAPSEDLKGKVVDEIQKGYLLNGKVIRFAKVVVGS